MAMHENIESFLEKLKDLSSNYKMLYSDVKQLEDIFINYPLVQKSTDYLKNENSRLEKIKIAYNGFSSQISQLCDNYINEIDHIEKEDNKEVEDLKSAFEVIQNELKMKNEGLKNVSLEKEKEFSFVYQKSLKSEMDVELVKKYPGSHMYRDYMSRCINKDGDIFIDHDGMNDEFIVKYMRNDKSLIDDMKKMDNEKREKLLDDLNFLELPIKKIFIKQLGCNEDCEIMAAWRNRKVVIVNGENNIEFIEQLHSNDLLDSLISNKLTKHIQFNNETNEMVLDIQLKYLDVIQDYLKNRKIRRELVKKYRYDGNSDELINEMTMIGIELNDKEKKRIRRCFDSRFLRGSMILLDSQYDDELREWLGNDYDMKLIYRASEHNYTANSFHKYCDDKGPTLIVVKSSEGWIFGGYTTQSWSGKCIYNDIILIINRCGQR